MAKMYYSEEEAAGKLGVSVGDLKQMVSEGKLKVYPDGVKRMFRAADVDALSGGGEGLELAPAGEEIELSAAEPGKPGKGDTVISSEGISIFDDEDLEIESDDPMAKTAIVPSVEEQINLEGVGSGSGLLDLTRESDDTSLGEVLEDIDVAAAVPSGSIVEEIPEETAAMAAEPVMMAPTVVETVDASAGAFSGLLLGGTLLMLVVGAVAVAVLLTKSPPYFDALYDNLPIVVGVGAVVAAILAGVGFFLGKAAADRVAALQRNV